MTRLIVGATLLSLAVGIGSAFADNTAPAPAGQPAKMSADDKKAISKSCTDQANAKGLHGKDRKKFRSDCKHNDGKAQ
jgi:psiF repeat